MTEQEDQLPQVSMTNTKKEILAAYEELVKKLEARREAELKPEEKIEERATREAVRVADGLSADGIAQKIGTIKSEVGQFLGQLTESLEQEVNKYRQIKKAVEAKTLELQEIYEIQKAASSLSALIETQNRARQDFEAEMAAKKEELTREIETMRSAWALEKERHEAELKERDEAERKKREREQEAFQYEFQRQQQLAQERFKDEQARMERELQYKREEMERELAERERAVAAKEEELNTLRERVQAFPQEKEEAIEKAVEEAVARVRSEAEHRETLLRKEFDGERSVLQTRIESLEKTVKEQQEQIDRLARQSEHAYSQVQDIAMKAVEGAAHIQSRAAVQPLETEQARGGRGRNRDEE